MGRLIARIVLFGLLIPFIVFMPSLIVMTLFFANIGIMPVIVISFAVPGVLLAVEHVAQRRRNMRQTSVFE